MPKKKPFLLNISGPYAVGKDTIINELLDSFPSITHRVSTITTRPVNKSVDPSYEGKTEEEFREIINSGQWIVNYQTSGKVGYGTSISEIEEITDQGRVCIHSIFASGNGAGRMREIFGDGLYSMFLTPSDGSIAEQLAVLKERLIKRGRDSIKTIEERLKTQEEILKYANDNPYVITGDRKMQVFDRIVVNKDLETTVDFIRNMFVEIFVNR